VGLLFVNRGLFQDRMPRDGDCSTVCFRQVLRCHDAGRGPDISPICGNFGRAQTTHVNQVDVKLQLCQLQLADSVFLARRAFDIGSGSIKCLVAEVDDEGLLHRELYRAQQQALFVNDIQKTGEIDSETQAQGAEIIHRMLHESSGLGVHESAAVATAAFRQASNGKNVLADYEEDTGITMRVVSAEEEARLGYMTARAYSDDSTRSGLVAWDCGAASFQLASGSNLHVDAHGSGTVLRRGTARADSLGRFTPEQIHGLVVELRRDVAQMPKWIFDPQNAFVAIGGGSSIFQQMATLSGLHRFGPDDVEDVLKGLSGLDHREVFQMEQERDLNADLFNAPYVVPKLALLLAVMRQCRMDQLQFHQTVGNCAGLLSDNDRWQQCASQVSPEANDSDALLTVNWHLQKDCNYSCTFCYAHFEDDQNQNMEREKGFKLLRALKDQGFFKVNFAGGEPLLNSNLGEYLRFAKEIGFKTSIITNASRMTKAWLWAYGSFIDQIGVSCDSLSDDVNKRLGRGFGNHVQITTRAFERVHALNQEEGLDIKIKLNTIVMKDTHLEDWSRFVIDNGVQRWKIFKILRIEGENDDSYDDLQITDAEFEDFVDRHAWLEEHGVVMAPEDNDDMTTSYIMVTPDGRFYQNSGNKYVYSEDILTVGASTALSQTGFDYDKFKQRGGEYAL